MQLKSIDQCKVGMTVYSPIYGVGKIENVETDFIFVSFQESRYYNEKDYGLPFFNNNKSSLLIQHLYMEPVFLCTRVGAKQIGYVYKPINPENEKFTKENIPTIG
ncbi:hypothetical protein SAMN05192529_102120 [Arachidicoccus rhizosphaerae]|uniref:Uncharacterized protein n=1 Tax=Arachidicoccus rhizosphaerae TaxID=551991 RepID=A0A1H3W454_9BACT|nr:hypothetical protein SAMN05192529_102120 [Arachidicoccus rhizosphaerae]